MWNTPKGDGFELKARKQMGQPWVDNNNFIEPQGDLTSKYQDNNLQVVAIGDSITYGYPYTPRESWVQLASQRLGIPIVNRGEPGEITAEMLARFYQDVVSLGPSHVIIMGGTNDALHNTPLSSFKNNLDQMTKKAKEAEVIPIIGIPIPINDPSSEEQLKTYRDWMRDLAYAQGYQILDFYATMVDKPSGFIKAGYHEDGIHPNRKGYQTMSEIVYIK